MTRKEMLKKIEVALENSFGGDPDTGETLYPHTDYMAYVVLKTVEELGMLPPNNACKLIPDGNGGFKHNPTLREWDEEV
jgi:hypothetical protein